MYIMDVLSVLYKIMYVFNEFSEIGYLVLRIALAIIFVYHAWPKVKNPAAMAGGVGMSVNTVRLIGVVELVGGLAIALGVLMQLAALALIVIMIGAIYYKIQKWKVPFWSQTNTGWEFDFILLAALFFLLTNAY
jgi:uncharacterized membrane protein YphA (DoxX/SURF4 family)